MAGGVAGYEIGWNQFAGGTPDAAAAAAGVMTSETHLLETLTDDYHQREQGALSTAALLDNGPDARMSTPEGAANLLHAAVPGGDHNYHVQLSEPVSKFYPRIYSAAKAARETRDQTEYTYDERALAAFLGVVLVAGTLYVGKLLSHVPNRIPVEAAPVVDELVIPDDRQPIAV
jgi:hypothetical protein